MRGDYRPGERLRQDAIATRCGVSQMIVREAFKQPVNEGFLRAEPRRGVSVTALSVRKVEEMTQLRSLLEAQALEWAIPEMREVDLRAAGRILDELDKAESVTPNDGQSQFRYLKFARYRLRWFENWAHHRS